MRRGNLKRKRPSVRDLDGERRWYHDAPCVCENPDCAGGHRTLSAHHCVYEQEVRRAGGDRWDKRNRLMLCVGCHMSHHQRTRPIALSVLPDSVIEFAAETLGTGPAYEYLTRRYAGADERVERLLVEHDYPEGVDGV